jgi:hypothetical protein
MYRNTKQKSTASSPPFWIGQKPRGKCAVKKADAISPLAMNAAYPVMSPTAMSSPPTNSMIPANPKRDSNGAEAPR